jgi:hypothetical protein
VSRKVHHGIDPPQGRTERRCIRQFSLDQLETVGEADVASREVVVDYRLMTLSFESTCGMASNVSRTAHHQNDQFVGSVESLWRQKTESGSCFRLALRNAMTNC